MTSSSGERTVAVVTGTRAEYGLLKSSMEAIEAHESLALSVVATGMHLSPRHGMTVDDIRADEFVVEREVLMQLDGDSGTAMAKSLGIGTMGLADAFDQMIPDVVLLLGDRDEALAATLAAVHMNIPVAHVHGGDSMQGATIDDSIRHAITKFAHLHFPASEASAARVRKLGEEPWRITTVGAPGLDDILDGRFDDPATVRERYDLEASRPRVLLVQHPVTTRLERAGEQMAATLDALESFDAQVVVVYPNADAGGQRMIEQLENRTDDDSLRTFRSLPRRAYLGVMAAADVMVGNSSSGIIEAPSFDLPVVDIGPRQADRERAENTLSVAHEREAIEDAVRQCLDEACRRRAAGSENPYDYGGAGERIAEQLATVSLDDDLLRKQLTF